MNFTIKLPANYSLEVDEQIVLEERFRRAFKSLIYKYTGNEVPFDKNAFFNIDYDDNANYLRLKTLSPQYPKDMHDEIVETLNRVFVESKSLSPR